MLLLLVLEMLEVLLVLKELVVFLKGKFERIKSPFFFMENYSIPKENFWFKKKSKNL